MHLCPGLALPLRAASSASVHIKHARANPVARQLGQHRYIASKSPPPQVQLPVPRPDYSPCLSDASAAIRNIAARRAPIAIPAVELVTRVRDLHSKIYQVSFEIKELRRAKNACSSILASKDSSLEEKEEARGKANELSGKLAVERELEGLEQDLLTLTLQLPNTTAQSAPTGGYDKFQITQSTPGRMGGAAFESPNPKADHVDLLTALGWLYLPNHITGSSWPYLMKGGAKLEAALTQYALRKAEEAGYELVFPPDVVRSELMKRCGFNPRDAGGEAQTYFVSTSALTTDSESSESTLALAATAEIPLAGLFIDKVYKSPDSELPKKVVALGHAFRAEAGSRGKESRGLYRVHQFSKVELFAVTDREGSQAALQDMTELQWSILTGLGLPLRLLNMPTEELGGAAFQKYDIESYMPGRASWGELASASNCTDYQARRLGIRYRASITPSDSKDVADVEGPKTLFAHTLNATAAAVPRLIVAITENGARFDEQGNWIALELPAVLKEHWIGKEAFVDSWIEQLAGNTVDAKAVTRKQNKARSVEIRWV